MIFFRFSSTLWTTHWRDARIVERSRVLEVILGKKSSGNTLFTFDNKLIRILWNFQSQSWIAFRLPLVTLFSHRHWRHGRYSQGGKGKSRTICGLYRYDLKSFIYKKAVFVNIFAYFFQVSFWAPSALVSGEHTTARWRQVMSRDRLIRQFSEINAPEPETEFTNDSIIVLALSFSYLYLLKPASSHRQFWLNNRSASSQD